MTGFTIEPRSFAQTGFYDDYRPKESHTCFISNRHADCPWKRHGIQRTRIHSRRTHDDPRCNRHCVRLAIPITDTSLRVNRLRGDATALRNLVGLAKIRASSRSTRARVRVDLGANTYALEIWDKTGGAWVNESGIRPLSTGVTFGFGALATAPPNTQATIGMSPECTAGLTADDSIANTACITFNSRGLPVDADGNLLPTARTVRAWRPSGCSPPRSLRPR